MRKNILNKTVSVLAAFVMLVSPISALGETDISAENTGNTEVAESTENTENTENTEVLGHYEMNVLNSLGIVNFTEAKLTQNVTNEEFAGAAALVGGIAKDYYQDGVLQILIDCGYMPSSSAYPDRDITYAQAVKTIVSALGYDVYAKNYGGYPGGYIIEAANLKITDGLDGISNDTPLTYGMMCVMMYNSLEVKMLVSNSYNGNTKSEKTDKVLNEVFEIYDGYGRVTANSITSLSGDNNYNPEKIEIDSKEYKNADSSYDDLIGYNVHYYYRHNAPYMNDALYMEIDEGANKILTVSKDDSTYVADKNIFYYTKNNSLKQVNLSDGYVLVYNKRVTKNGLEKYQGDIDGSVTLVDTNSDGKYDFVEISSYTTIYVSVANGYSKEIFDKFDTAKSVCLDDTINDSQFIIRDTSGNEIQYSAIKEGNVVSVLISDDKKIGTAIVSDKVLKANVDEIENANGSTYIYANGERYAVADSAKDYIGEITLGAQYQLSFDFQGEIAGFVSSDSVFNYGLIMSVVNDTDKAKEPVTQLKIFTSDGKVEKHYFAENVTIDGDKYKKSAKESAKKVTNAYKALYMTDDNGDEVYKSKFIRYKLKDDFITEIDTAYYDSSKEDEKSLHQIGKTSNKTIHREGQYFYTALGDGVVYDGAVTVFLGYRVDLDGEDENGYSVMKVADFASGYSVPNISAYTTDLKTPDASYIVVGLTKDYATDMQNNNLSAMCFEKITKRVSGEDEKYCVVGWDLLKNTSIEIEVDDIAPVAGFTKGDMFSYRLTPTGEFGKVYLAYDASAANHISFIDEMGVNGAAAPSGGAQKWMHGMPYASSLNYIYLLPYSKSSDAKTLAKSNFNDCKMVAHKRRSPNYYVYDQSAVKSNGKSYLTPVTRSDLNDYMKTGAGADTVLVLSCPSEYSAVIIFR